MPATRARTEGAAYLEAKVHPGKRGALSFWLAVGFSEIGGRAATKPLELEKSALSYQRIPPGYRFPYGHTHTKQEEVYVVLRGRGRMKIDDEIVELREWDVVRMPPGTWRGYEAGPEGLEILVVGAPNLGDDPREDVDGQRHWWVD
jgi:mannose-6-phosphate isomerase-like protein (cupin superfamily)